MKDRSILSPSDYKKLVGSVEAAQYRFDEERKVYIKSLKLIKGLTKAKEKAERFVLATKVGSLAPLFLTKNSLYPKMGSEYCLSNNIKEAVQFYEGFDDPEVKAKLFQEKLNINFYYYKVFKR